MKISKTKLKRLIREEIEAQSAEFDSWWESLNSGEKSEGVAAYSRALVTPLARQVFASMKNIPATYDKGGLGDRSNESVARATQQLVARSPKFSKMSEEDIAAAIEWVPGDMRGKSYFGPDSVPAQDRLDWEDDL